MTIASVLLVNALRLPLADWQALTQGQMIAAMPWNFVSLGQTFALYPTETDNTNAQFWATCEFCKSIDDPKSLEALSKLTTWTTQELEVSFQKREFIFLAFLRVYRIPKSVEVVRTVEGEFLPLTDPLLVSKSLPILNDVVFNQRKQQLNELQPPLHPELEELQSAIALLALSDPAAREFDRKIRTFLGWTHDNITKPNPDLNWIKTISKLGDRSKEQDDGRKTNYQAGTDFENVVHKGLEFLGFTVDEAHKGGAGGLDLFCSKPYALAGECKAGKKIPDHTVEQLDRIGKRHLRENYMSAVRLIIGSGEPSKQLQESSITSKVSLLNSMTFERLVKLQAQYPNSVNLLDLKDYLLPGEIDRKIDEYADKVLKEIKVRSCVVEAVKQLTETEPDDGKQFEVSEIRVKYNGLVSDSSDRIDNQTMYELLIELSSPLTGYLGRLKVTSLTTDRFYYLRDLPVN